MKVTIDVQSRAEGDAIRLALNDPATRTSVLMIGALLQLEELDLDARQRVLKFVNDRFPSAPTREPAVNRLNFADASA